MNMLTTKKVVQLAHQIPSLKSFVHVSTIHSNTWRPEVFFIDEKIYEHTFSYEHVISASNQCHDDDNKSLPLLAMFANTYTMTKHFGEKIVHNDAVKLPAGIFRCPIILNNYQDHPGYIETLDVGPAGLLMAIDQGHVRMFNIKRCVYINDV
jgi:alcohol-forming fatty acyl-CoA reductase